MTRRRWAAVAAVAAVAVFVPAGTATAPPEFYVTDSPVALARRPDGAWVASASVRWDDGTTTGRHSFVFVARTRQLALRGLAGLALQEVGAYAIRGHVNQP